MSENIIVTTGIYDVIKDHLRRKKVSRLEEDILTAQLRNATQVLRRDLPEDVVTVNRIVTVKDHASMEEKEYIIVPTAKAKPNKNKHSILSDIALATVGHKVGTVIEWPFRDGTKTIEITKILPFEQN